MQLFDDLLERLRLDSTVFCRMSLAGDWGFTKAALQGAPFHIVLSGRAWVELAGERGFQLASGDVVILPGGQPHRLLARPGVAPVSWSDIADEMGLSPWEPGARFKALDLSFGDGQPVTRLISGVFAFEDKRRNPVLAALPPILHHKTSGDPEAARSVASLVSLLETELVPDAPGAAAVCTRLADILFIQIVRHHLAAASLPAGWLRGVADPRIAPALVLIQNAPHETWSVAALAKEVGMSRSHFAARFRDVVGKPPLDFLTDWRMYQATIQLADIGVPVKSVAASIGYASDVSFSKAFKRWAGHSPAAYRRRLGNANGAEGIEA
ncbi:AraC family transcriptional regulator [Acuticoccus sediminis]|nr:AraC family transcriptional regulator [Acuticoccus sediminis]